jgi:glycosyltransferase involved in cell wall biosynthesis
MKILVSVQYFYPPVGGAEHSLISIVKKLAETHDIYVLQLGEYEKTRELDQIKLINVKIPLHYKLMLYDQLKSPRWIYHLSPIIFQAQYWKKNIEEQISEIDPDLIITQLNFAPPTVDIAVKHNIPSIMFIRSYEHFCPIGYINGIDCNGQCNNCISLQNKIHYLHVNKWLKWNLNAIRNSSLVIANSKFIANITNEICAVKPVVVYPTIDTKKYHCKSDLKEFITIINPTNLKGSEIFLEIAKRLPDQKFIAVGGSKKLQNNAINGNLGNITFLEKTSNIVDIYAKTKILLTPVKWPEPFGRVVIEAGVSGIPTIASNRGGLPEAVGNGGIIIEDIYNIDKWVGAIRSLDDIQLYQELSNNAKKNALIYSYENNLNKLREHVYKKLGFSL